MCPAGATSPRFFESVRGNVLTKTTTQHKAVSYSAVLLLQTYEYDLLPGQGNLAVTLENKLLYVQLLADWHLQARLGPAAAAFARGLHTIIPRQWFGMFSAGELNQLISGGKEGGLDVEDMQR